MIRDRGTIALVEVKTRMDGDPVTRFDDSKIRALRRAADRMRPRPQRIDLVTVEMGEGAALVIWRRAIA